MPGLIERKNVKAVCAVSKPAQTKPSCLWRKSMTTLPGKTASPTLGLEKQSGRLWLNIILLIFLVMTILSLPGGHAIHIVGGILVLIGCGVHLILHRRWIKAMILETPKNGTPGLRRQRRLFWGMLLSGLICGLSGVVGLPFHVHDPLVSLPVHCCVAPIHVLSGLIFLGLNIYHLVLHQNWFRKNLTIFSTTPKS
jgi:hypothetical protein